MENTTKFAVWHYEGADRSLVFNERAGQQWPNGFTLVATVDAEAVCAALDLVDPSEVMAEALIIERGQPREEGRLARAFLAALKENLRRGT
jgi:hypothetical protein